MPFFSGSFGGSSFRSLGLLGGARLSLVLGGAAIGGVYGSLIAPYAGAAGEREAKCALEKPPAAGDAEVNGGWPEDYVRCPCKVPLPEKPKKGKKRKKEARPKSSGGRLGSRPSKPGRRLTRVRMPCE